MIDPTEDDVGRKVVYRERGNFPGRKVEEGVITSFNRWTVFVRYGTNTGSAATAREDLEWVSPPAFTDRIVRDPPRSVTEENYQRAWRVKGSLG